VCVLFTDGVWKVAVSVIVRPQHLCTCVDEIMPPYEIGVVQSFSLVC
jgi:hypothetical protein